MINPYFCYLCSFAIAFAFYLLGWSSLYPRLSTGLVFFLFVTCLLHAAAGIYWKKKQFISYKKIKPSLHPVAVTLFIYALWITEFLYEGGIPFVKLLLHQPYNYRLFGIPSLHVFVVTFSSFYTIHLFHCFLSDRRRNLLILYLVNLFAAILIYSRAMLFFNLAGSAMIFLFSVSRVPWRNVGIAFALSVVLLYVFGVLGTIRDSAESKVNYNPGLFLETGKATDNFKSSFIPREFFWSYIYISSPLANLQTNVDRGGPHGAGIERFLEMINNEWLFDALSKRINGITGHTRAAEITIPGPFNVSTVYSRSYSYLGWTGIWFTAVFLLVLPWGYKWLIDRKPTYGPEGMAILCTMYLFLVYDNTVRFTGLSFQLVYPFLFTWLGERFKLAPPN